MKIGDAIIQSLCHMFLYVSLSPTDSQLEISDSYTADTLMPN